MQRIIISEILLVAILAFASNSLLSVAANRTSGCGGNEVKKMLLSSTTCPTTCYDSNGKYCCGQ